MASQTNGSGTQRAARGLRRSWVLPAGTFLAGLALGGVVVGAGGVGGDDEPAAATAAAVDADVGGDTDGAADSGPAAPDRTGLYVRVPDSCVRTADDATTLVEHVDRVVAAIAELEPERLRQTVDEVQQIRDEVQDVAEQCRAAAEQRLRDAAGAEPDDSAPPTPAS